MTTSQASVSFTTASVGKKVLMAITGICLIGFLIVHLIGNLQLFIGQEQLNKYAETLQSLGGLKWGFRLFMLVLAVIHVWKGVVLWLENRRARPIGYHREDTVQASLSSRTMIYTGLLIFAFVVYHLLHFTLIVTNPEYAQLKDSVGRVDVYSMVITGFSNYAIAIAYLIAMFLLAYHLSHASESFFQTMGWANDKYLPKLKILSNLFAIVIFIGYASMPIAVLLNIVKLPGGGN
ncbi:MAG: succinate dehydrogenase cytochrome b subunit [Candidatus Zixiibacteriota bacterium]|nr:MAG: succinate dehydrogenase cytochrome b subunit [candidate division Zixibacteria bacterium]